MSAAAFKVKESTPKNVHPEESSTQPQSSAYSTHNLSDSNVEGEGDQDGVQGETRTDDAMDSDQDASGDEDVEMDGAQKLVHADRTTGRKDEQTEVEDDHSKRRLRPSTIAKDRKKLIDKGESGESDEEEDSDAYGEDEREEDGGDVEADPPYRNPLDHLIKTRTKKGYYQPTLTEKSTMAKRSMKTVKDFPSYAQHAYLSSTYNVPPLPVPVMLIPGLRSRPPPPVPISDLIKRSRGRHVSSDESDRKFACTVGNCDKRFARGEHLKRHIRSIHTHEKPHQCPYPRCLRSFSRTDNMMQHMRTHEDWPDDEMTFGAVSDADKGASSFKGKSSATARANKSTPRMSMMPPFPWLPPFINQLQNGTGVNPQTPISFPMFPFLPPPGMLGQSASEGNGNGEAGVTLTSNLSGADQEPLSLFNSPNGSTGEKPPGSAITARPSTIPPNFLSMPPMPPQPLISPRASTLTSRPAAKKTKHSRKASKAGTTISVISDATAPPSTPGSAIPDNAADLLVGNPVVPSTVLPGAPAPSIPQGAQLSSTLPMGSQMQLPPGIPWPLPSIGIPIPPGASLPHASQLPPNARIEPDGEGGHTIIIPPPQFPYGMPFPPGTMPPSMVSLPMQPGSNHAQDKAVPNSSPSKSPIAVD